MVFFERCVKSVSLIGDSVDRTAEPQALKGLENRLETSIIENDLAAMETA